MPNIEDFMEWLNDEITKYVYRPQDTVNAARKSAFVEVRQKICDLDASNKGMDISEIEYIAGEICDHYCKFPEAYYTGHDDDNQRMIEERCNKCPLNRVVK